MKTLCFLVLLTSLCATAAANKLSCRFPTHRDVGQLENCASKLKQSVQIEKSVLKDIAFDGQGLAGGTIAAEGCYWLRNDGLLRKTLCFDNGADYFVEGLARYIDARGKMGYMDTKLRITIPARYDFAFPFEKGRAEVCLGCKSEKIPGEEHSSVKGGQWHVLDKSGKIRKDCSGNKPAKSCAAKAK